MGTLARPVAPSAHPSYVPRPFHPDPAPAPLWVLLPEADPDLVRGIPAADRGRARGVLTAPARELDVGTVSLGGTPSNAFALLIVAGRLSSDVEVHGHTLTEMLLPGDVVLMSETHAGTVAGAHLQAIDRTRVAILDQRFLLACAKWPQLMDELQGRLTERHRRLAAHGAICQLSRVEHRLLAILEHLADRVGRVTKDGVVVELQLTHTDLGNLVGAKRPTVSLGLKQLQEDGVLCRRSDGMWVLPPGVSGAVSSQAWL